MKKISNNKNILNYFPNIELFYNLTYKKVSNYNLILAIPRGNKCFIWFTKINGKKSAILINIDITSTSTNTNKINFNFSNIYLLNNQFNSELLETILYGTSFEVQNKFYFSIEDLFYYKKTQITTELFVNKLKNLNYTYEDLVKLIADEACFKVELEERTSDLIGVFQDIVNSYKPGDDVPELNPEVKPVVTGSRFRATIDLCGNN